MECSKSFTIEVDPGTDLNTDLIQWYPLDEAAGNPRLDIDGAFALVEIVSPVGTLAGAPLTNGISAAPGNALNAQLLCAAPKAGTEFQNTSYSLCMWFFLKTATGPGTIENIINHRDPAGTLPGWVMNYDEATQSLYWAIINLLGSTTNSSFCPIAVSTWMLYTVTYNFGSQQLLQYINGVGITNDPAFPPSDAPLGTQRLRLGTASFEWFAAQGMGMWGRELTAAEVLELYNGGAGISPPF